jgi:hypothetical protein
MHVERMVDMRNAHKILVRKPEGKTPLGRPRRRCKYDMKLDLKEIDLVGVNWMHVAQDRDR